MGLPSTLAALQAEASGILHWPENLGIEFRSLQLAAAPQTELLIIFIPGLADEELVRRAIIEPLLLHTFDTARQSAPTIQQVTRVLPVARLSVVPDLATAVQGVMEGDTALLLPGAEAATLVKTASSAPLDKMRGPVTWQSRFDSGLLENVLLIRKRLQDPNLIARPLNLPETRTTGAALVYLEGRVSLDVLGQVQTHLQKQAGEGAYRQGLAAGLRGKWGLLPTFLTTPWPDKVTALLDSGHVAILVDGVPQAFLAPVTVAATLYSPLDATLSRAVAVILRGGRFVLAIIAVTAAGTIVSLMNYHQEMMPTPFLFSLAVVREQAPLPVVMEVFVLELLQEMVRESAYQWPFRLSPGSVLVAGKLLMLILTQAGVVGTGTAAFSVIIMFSTFGFFGYELIYLLRPWRYLIFAGGAIFGFFGMATVLFGFLLYLMTAESFGLPFIGESGLALTAGYRLPPRKKGRDIHATEAGVR
ncbi:MAG TPA: spore germination protein [Symbiobacteriaceae bacterium]|nr:spore germination protein [Symbiobacteriaceae bacterium]